MIQDTLTKIKNSIQLDETARVVVEYFLINYYYIFLTVGFILLMAFLALSARYILAEAKKISTCSWLIVLGLFVTAMAVRFFVLSHQPQVYYDEVTFIETAENYYANGLNMQNYFNTNRNRFLICSTGWPYLVSLAFRFTGVNIRAAFAMSALLSVLTVILVFWTGTLLFKNENAGLWSASIFSVYPVFLRLSTSSAMGTSSVFFVFLTLLCFILYFRNREFPLLYLSFCSLAYTVNIRQEAFLTLLPLLLLFFFLFHPDIKEELKKPHIYVCLLLVFVLSIPPALASLYGISTGFYYFYESPDKIQQHINHNLLYNFSYWIANRIQPLSITLLGLFSFLWFFPGDRKLCLYFAGWFAFLYVFYTINPSCDFSGLITLDSWRNVFHLLVPVIMYAGLGPVLILEYFRENYPRARTAVLILLILSVLLIPVRFSRFIDQKTLYARENIFIRHFSRQVPSNSRIILDGGIKSSLWPSYSSLYSYTSRIPGRHYEMETARPLSRRKLLLDYLRWHEEKRPVFLYLTSVNTETLEREVSWYFETFKLRMVGGMGLKNYRSGYVLYEITGIKKLPYFMYPYLKE